MVGKVPDANVRLASLAMMTEKDSLQSLSSDVGIKSRGDDLLDIDQISLRTSSSVTGGRLLRTAPQCCLSSRSGTSETPWSFPPIDVRMLLTLSTKKDAHLSALAASSAGVHTDELDGG